MENIELKIYFLKWRDVCCQMLQYNITLLRLAHYGNKYTHIQCAAFGCINGSMCIQDKVEE